MPPNIVFIMSDELAYYELSHMGNEKIHTPNIDKMAEEGTRFTQALAGSPVCAPLRCNLMTGKHAGHASIRANDGGTPLRADEATIASILKDVGYATGGFGKWGCGGRDSTGVPEKHGFDVFFGYYDQVHAHSFYPEYLIRNSNEVRLPGNSGGRSGKSYSHYAIMKEGLDFIRRNKDRPFFCYLPITPPHGMYDIPADDPAWELYLDDAWMKDPSVRQETKNYAAMVSMVDRNVGDVLDLLNELSLSDNTIVFFSGDNGGQDRFRSDAFPRGFFGPNVDPRTGVEFRGGKGSLYEGGLRIPFIVRWPNKIPPGTVSDLLFYQPDILPTLAELTGATVPPDVDGLSILPELFGNHSAQKQHDYMYWEYQSQVAVRKEHWKAVRPKKVGSWNLYDLKKDISETTSVAAANPEILEEMIAFADRSHEPVRPGKYLDNDRKRHQRDRDAKWGSAGPVAPARMSGRIRSIRHKNLILAKKIKLMQFSSENKSNNRLAAYAFDGDPRTLWHSEFSGKSARHPHQLVIDLGAPYAIEGFIYLARQDDSWNGAFARTEFSVGDRPKKFRAPVAKKTFTKDRDPQFVKCASGVSGRYVRIRVLSEVNRATFASAAEIGVIGTPIR